MRTAVFTLGILGLVAGVACSPADPKNPPIFNTPSPGTTPGVAPVTPGTTPGVAPVTPITPGTTPGVTPVTPGTTPGVTPVTPITPGTTPGVTPVTPGTTTTTPTTDTPPVAECTGTKDTIAIAENGWVPAECNNFGINGAWYCYDDGVNPSGCTADTPPYDAAQTGMCLKGNTTVDEEFAAWGAGIGFSLNTVDDEKQPWDATANHVLGFKIKIVGEVNDLPLRISFKNEASEDETPPQFQLPGPGDYMVLFDDAAVPDWADESIAGNPVDPSAIYDVQIQVAGGETAADYEFCVTEFTPITDGTTPEPGGALQNYGSPQGGQYDMITFGKYVVQNNRYGGNTHSIQALWDNGDKAGFELSGVSGNVAVGQAPGSYPSIVYGWHVDGKFYGGYQTAKTIGSITSIPTTADVTVPGAPAIYNTSYDLWVSSQANPGANGSRTEVMIWLNRPGSDPYPIGTKQTTIQLGGQTWEVWYDTDIGEDNFHTVSYVQTALRSATLDIKDFLTAAVASGYVQDSEYLLGVQFGFEIWQAGGGDAFKVNSYSVSIN
jgi:hypothetical protein